jgi:hypothetical protein
MQAFSGAETMTKNEQHGATGDECFIETRRTHRWKKAKQGCFGEKKRRKREAHHYRTTGPYLSGALVVLAEGGAGARVRLLRVLGRGLESRLAALLKRGQLGFVALRRARQRRARRSQLLARVKPGAGMGRGKKQGCDKR